ncbi:hypothetical protein THOG11_70190 [Vibrio harveyi]|nr:hypothetical protein TH15OA1_460189 [Vibrio harveyi]CAH1578033.1 hypothetical protein THOD03_60190 [Vibrio harveyi]CAH1587095.1 hypothetical protein THOG11_70190 [Vibrio harveyi]
MLVKPSMTAQVKEKTELFMGFVIS